MEGSEDAAEEEETGSERRKQEGRGGNRREEEETGGKRKKEEGRVGNRNKQEKTGGSKKKQEERGGVHVRDDLFNDRGDGSSSGDRWGGVTGWMDASVHCKLLEQGSIWVHENLSPLHEYLIHISCVHVRQTETEKGRIFPPLSLVITKTHKAYFVAFES